MKIQDIYKSLGEYGCLIFCYLKEAEIDADIVEHFDELINLGIIDEDCFVNDGNKLIKYFGSNKKVVWGKNKNGNTIVPYKNGDYGHFVIVDENDEVIFNSLEKSKCVKFGKPAWERARYLSS